MAGEKDVKYAHACNQSQQFMDKMIEEAKKTPAGAVFQSDASIKGTVVLDEDTDNALKAKVSALKDLLGSGNLELSRDMVRELTGEAEFRVSVALNWDRSKDKDKA
jgi:hypothetical protein